MNLARSLLDACERTPSSRRSPGSATASCCRGSRGSPAASASSRATAWRVVLDNRLETALLYWACQWAGASSCRSRGGCRAAELAYCVEDCRRRARDPRRRPAARRRRAPRRARPRRARDLAAPLHLGTTGRPKGVPRSHAPTAPAAWPGAPARLRYGDRTLGVMPLYHTMGIHSLLAMHLVGGCYVRQPRWDPGEALAADRARSGSRRCTSPRRCSTTSSTTRTRPRRDVSWVRALGYAGAAMTARSSSAASRRSRRRCS